MFALYIVTLEITIGNLGTDIPISIFMMAHSITVQIWITTFAGAIQSMTITTLRFVALMAAISTITIAVIRVATTATPTTVWISMLINRLKRDD